MLLKLVKNIILPLPSTSICNIFSSFLRSIYISFKNNPDFKELILTLPDLSALIKLYDISSIFMHLICCSCS